MGASPINDPDESTEGSDDENDADESPAPMSTRPPNTSSTSTAAGAFGALFVAVVISSVGTAVLSQQVFL
jgi:hypothetical protein